MYPEGTRSELLASGEYESEHDRIMKGFRIFQKKYVYKNVIIQMILLFIAAVIQVVGIMTDGFSPVCGFIIIALIVLAVYILSKPRLTYKKLSEAIKSLDGIIYRADMYTDKIVISTIYDPETEKKDDEDEKNEQEDTAETSEDDQIPATVIHIDQGVVDLLDADDMYITYIKGTNMYVIPKCAFSENECAEMCRRYENMIGTHYRKI